MAFKRGATPTITIVVNGMTFQGYKVYVTIEDPAGTQITKNSDGPNVTKTVLYDDSGTATGCSIAMTLSQEETLSLQEGTGQLQLTWINSLGDVDKSEIGKYKIDRTLYEQTVEF